MGPFLILVTTGSFSSRRIRQGSLQDRRQIWLAQPYYSILGRKAGVTGSFPSMIYWRFITQKVRTIFWNRFKMVVNGTLLKQSASFTEASSRGK
jgi:hypothetical protein